ncbi:hypothetical protein DFH09DRAFT_1071345 [Mycena vulgaris]|nr:hypothetical protein DFH09DRAFT_1071345 [Mycena vulgaris]
MIAARLFVAVAVASSCACPIWQIPSAGVDTGCMYEFGGLDQRWLPVGLRTRAAPPIQICAVKTKQTSIAPLHVPGGGWHQTSMHSQVQCRLRRDSEVSLVIGVDLITPWGKLQAEVPRLGAASGRCRVDSTTMPGTPGARPPSTQTHTQPCIVIPSLGGGIME